MLRARASWFVWMRVTEGAPEAQPSVAPVHECAITPTFRVTMPETRLAWKAESHEREVADHAIPGRHNFCCSRSPFLTGAERPWLGFSEGEWNTTALTVPGLGREVWGLFGSEPAMRNLL